MKAMILAAGLGTRLKPWTDNHPKALAVVNGKSLLQLNLEYLQRFEIKEVVVNVHHFADQITEAIKNNKGWGSTIHISYEPEVLETGGGLTKASSFFKNEKAFILINVDILTDLDLYNMIDFHYSNSPLATLATSERKTSRYLLFNANNNLCGWRNVNTNEEKKGLSDFTGIEVQKAFNGIHIICPDIFPLIIQKDKFSMIDVYLSLMDKYHIKSFDMTGNSVIDVGTLQNIFAAGQLFKS